MCTVSYLPGDNNTFILTHNRDESIERPLAAPPVKRRVNGTGMVYPVDTGGGGTWIGMTSGGKAASLLNGGRKKHRHKPPYRHSRGLIIPSYLSATDFYRFYRTYQFAGLEPFTLLAFEEGRVYELVHEEEQTYAGELDPALPFIRFSYPLYPADSMAERQLSFYQCTRSVKKPFADYVMEYHRGQRFELEHIPKHDTGKHILRTVSITQVIKSAKAMEMKYEDCVNDIRLKSFLPIRQQFD